MAKVYIKIRIMPASTSTDLNKIKNKVRQVIDEDGSKLHKIEQIPIAFGLQSVEFILMRDESKGGTDVLEHALQQIEGVESVSVLDVRRAIG